MAKLLRRVYSRIFWKNEDESKTTPLGKSNLNKEDEALEIIDQRVCDLSNDKAEVSEVQDSIIYYDIEPISGNITVRTRGGGEKIFYIYQLIPRLAAVKAEADRAENMAETATNQAGIATSAATAANQYMQNAKNSADAAKVSETNAKDSENEAKVSEELILPVKPIAEEAIAAAENIRDVEANVEAMVDKLLDEITGTFVGALTAKGTIPFESLPTTDIQLGEMYNISNNFVSDSRFADGAGIEYKAGSNVYWTMDGKWDVLAAPASAKVLETSGSDANVLYDDIGIRFFGDGSRNYIQLNSFNGLQTFIFVRNMSTTAMPGVPFLSVKAHQPNGNWGNVYHAVLVDSSNNVVSRNPAFYNLKLWDGVRTRDCIFIYDDGDGTIDYGSEMVIGANGNTFIGGGEAATNLRNALINGNPPHPLDYVRSGENVFVVADGMIHLIAGYQNPTAANMACVYLNNAMLACTPEHRIQLGYSDRKWTNVWTDKINNIGVDTLAATGSGTPFGKFVWVSTNGDTEVGRYLDFHTSNSDMDYSARMEVVDAGGTIELKSGGRNQSTDNPRFRIIGNTTARSSDFWLINNATGQQIALSLGGNGQHRGLWDIAISYWCYIDSANKAWFKGTADMANADNGNNSLLISYPHTKDYIISGSATATIYLDETLNKTRIHPLFWLIAIQSYTTSSGALYGTKLIYVKGNSSSMTEYSGNTVTGTNVATSTNAGFTINYYTGREEGSTSYIYRPYIVVSGTANRTCFVTILQC